jgi:hypothetical protein
MISREEFFMLTSGSRLFLKCNPMFSVGLVHETPTHSQIDFTYTHAPLICNHSWLTRPNERHQVTLIMSEKLYHADNVMFVC